MCRDRYELPAALELSLEAVGAIEAAEGPESPSLVEALIVLTSVQQAGSSLDEAERMSLRAVAIAEKLPDEPELVPLRLRALESLAVTYRLQGRYAEAEDVFRRALAEAEEHLGQDATPVADLLSGLAIAFKYWGRFDEAEALYRRALAIAERADGADSSAVASIYHNLGGLEHARGDYAGG